MASLLLRGISLIPRAFNFVKPYIPQIISGISKGVKYVSGIAQKVAEVGSKLSAGYEVARNIIGPEHEGLKKFEEASGVKTILGDITNAAGKVAKLGEGIGSLLTTVI